MIEIEKLLTEYLDYLEIEKNRSPKTRRNYEHYLTVFFKQAGIKSYKDITAESVRAFRIYLARQRVARGERPSDGQGELMKKVSQNYYVIAIRNFLKFLIKRDYQVLAPDKIELPKLPTRQIEIIEYNDLERLLIAPEGSDLRSLRDRAILEMLFSTGLRISELCGLSRYIDLTRDELTVRGKGEKLRVVFLSDTCKSALKAYLAKRTDALEWLFVSLTKTPAASAKAPARQSKVIGKITTRAVQRLVNFYARKAGITRHLTPHGLRHLFATDLLINGADIRSVQEMLGHSNIATTQIYTHLTNKQLKDIHKNFHGKRR